MKFLCVSALWVALFMPVVSSAQSGPGDAQTPRVRLGPLALRPAVAISNFGVDGNVFNQAETDQPRSDFTMTLTPTTDWWIRVGRSTLSGTAKEDLVYYRTYSTERSINSTYATTMRVPFNRLTVSGGGDYASTRDRFGFEVDARARHTRRGVQGRAQYRAFGKTSIELTARRSRVSFAQDAVFLGSNLALELNRVTTAAGAAVQYRITPYTSLSLTVERTHDRFEFSTRRDSKSTSVAGGVTFAASALVSGWASFGHRTLEPRSSEVTAYSGPTAVVNLTYVARGATKLGVHAVRELQYSYEIDQPYYVHTGITGSVSQHVAGPFDVSARLGVQRLAYQGRIGVVGTAHDRVDTVRVSGGSLIYRFGREMRMGFNVDNQHRSSDLAAREYDGLRFGTSVTYGF